MSAALSKLKSYEGGPSMLICIKQSSVDDSRRFLSSVLIHFIAENACSHSAVLTGTKAATMVAVSRMNSYYE